MLYSTAILNSFSRQYLRGIIRPLHTNLKNYLKMESGLWPANYFDCDDEAIALQRLSYVLLRWYLELNFLLASHLIGKLI
jgi:hypothetical protein